MKIITTILLTFVFSSLAIADGPGHLVIVGGGGTPDVVLKKMVQLAGGKDANIVVFPQASTRKDRGSRSVQMFASIGADKAQSLELDDLESVAKAIEKADLIWFSGGSQRRLAESLHTAKLVDAIRRRYAAGAVIAGSSAGAAVMSELMIPGSPAEQRFVGGNTPISRGFALAPELIIDQHFIRRSRMYRLLSAVMDHPDRIGVGIDERTAIIVSGKRLTVYGDSSVVIIDARGGKAQITETGHLQTARKIRMDVLSQGDSFDFATSISTETPTNIVKLYGNRNYDGWEAIFGVGEFTRADLLAAGGTDNDVDSVRVASGYKVELYDEDIFGGTPEIHTKDNPDTTWHNQVTSLKVMTVSGANDTDVRSSKITKDTLTLDGHPIYEGRRILLDKDSYPRKNAKILGEPRIETKNGQTQIVFALDKADDVLVRVVDANGKTITNLACGVLGNNAPPPFQKNSLHQEIVWEQAEQSLKAGHKVLVKVGCEPRFDRFIAHDPNQLVKHICGMEVDNKGRLYVSFFTERRGDTEVRRYDRQGNLLGTVYPPSPDSVKGELSDIYRHVDTLDGKAFPQKRAWPFFIYKYHSKFEKDPSRYPFPFRVAPDGKAYVAEIVAGNIGMTLGEIAKLPPVKSRIFEVELDPFWFLQRMSMGAGVWAIGPQGHGYLCCSNGRTLSDMKKIDVASYKNEKFIGNTIIKVSLDTMEQLNDFAYNGTRKLDTKRCYLGTVKKEGKGPEFFNDVRDITLDQDGTLYVINENRIKTYQADGKYIGNLEGFALDGKSYDLGDVYGIRATQGFLYVVGRFDPIMENTRRGETQTGYKSAHLVKFRIKKGAKAQAVSRLVLNGLANVVAVDTSDSTAIVWVGNGGGEACFTRIEDKGQSFENVKHIRGVRKQVIKYPWSVAVDGRGRVYTYDYDRGCIVRSNEDGTDWLESEKFYLDLPSKTKRNRSLFVDRKRERLYRSYGNEVLCTDLDFKNIEVKFPEGRLNMGGIDTEGNLIFTGVGKTSFGNTVLPLRNRYGPDGFNGLVHQYEPDGRLKRAGLIEMYQGLGGVAVDSKGCIYVMDTAKAQFQYVVHDVGRLKYKGNTPTWKRDGKEILNQSELAYLVKFSAEGGKRGTEAELWAHRGASPLLSQCNCGLISNTVAVDEADRIFHTDYSNYHVKILDTAGNLIARAGAWGNANNQGPDSKHPNPPIAFSWLHGIDAANDALYASDKDLRRIVKIRLDYRETKEAR